MFTSFHSIIPHILAIAWSLVLFLPAKSLRWGWLWFTQILFTEWISLAFIISVILPFIEPTTLWFFFLLLFFQSRRRGVLFKKSKQEFINYNWNLPSAQLLLRNVFPFRFYPRATVKKSQSGLEHLYFPKEGSSTICFHIHGGAWRHGDPSQLLQIVPFFHKNNIEVLSLNYEKYPRHKLQDIVQIIEKDFLQLSQQFSGKDIILYGRSAGGHLALQLGSTFSNKVKKVISLYPVTDLEILQENSTDSDILKTRSWLNGVVGGTLTDCRSRYKDLSPCNLSFAKDTSVFLVHGENDPIVPVSQSDRLFETLRAQGHDVSYLKFNYGTHGFDALFEGISMITFKKKLQEFIRK